MFQVFLNGEKVYDRQAPGAVDFLRALKEIHKIRETIRSIFTVEPAATASH